jgi:uncharacterized membrane protein YgdD (TMEM256/DUF423 family)
MFSPSRFPFLAAGIFGLTGVGLGAMGAHVLAATLAERGMAHAWETGALYHLFHALAVFGAAIWLRGSASRTRKHFVWATRCWVAGILLFSGSLYWLALGGPRWLGPVTPLGGVALMAGWVLVISAAFVTDDA